MGRDLDIESALAEFNRRNVAPLRGLASRASAEGLLQYMTGPHQVAATWCLKAQAERAQLSQEEMARVFSALPELSQPDAILHVLQMVRFSPDLARANRPYFVALAGHAKLLIRVWAFDAYIRTSLPGEEEDRDERIRQGLQQRSKAMQARARNLAREFGVNLGA